MSGSKENYIPITPTFSQLSHCRVSCNNVLFSVPYDALSTGQKATDHKPACTPKSSNPNPSVYIHIKLSNDHTFFLLNEIASIEGIHLTRAQTGDHGHVT